MRCPVFQGNTYALRLDGFWSVDCLVSSPIARDIWTRSGRRACTSMSLFFLQRLFSWYRVYMMKWLICVGAPWWKLLLSPLIGGRMFIVTDLLLGVGWQPPYVEFRPSGFCLTLVPLPFVRDNFQGPGCYKYFQAMRCQVSPFLRMAVDHHSKHTLLRSLNHWHPGQNSCGSFGRQFWHG